MKRIAVVLALLSVALAGCSREQRVEAGHRAQQAGQKIRETAATAQKGLSDGAITAKVKSAMSLSDKLDTSTIDVDTKDRVVHLRGTARDGTQKALAERIASDTVASDTKVVSELAVRTASAPKVVKP
jgi:hypothetical protein